MSPTQEIIYLIGAIDVVKAEPFSSDQMERIRTLELCLLAAARKLSTEGK
jgi:hypothetical protein